MPPAYYLYTIGAVHDELPPYGILGNSRGSEHETAPTLFHPSPIITLPTNYSK
jgi:hypothetical protein